MLSLITKKNIVHIIALFDLDLETLKKAHDPWKIFHEQFLKLAKSNHPDKNNDATKNENFINLLSYHNEARGNQEAFVQLIREASASPSKLRFTAVSEPPVKNPSSYSVLISKNYLQICRVIAMQKGQSGLWEQLNSTFNFHASFIGELDYIELLKLCRGNTLINFLYLSQEKFLSIVGHLPVNKDLNTLLLHLASELQPVKTKFPSKYEQLFTVVVRRLLSTTVSATDLIFLMKSIPADQIHLYPDLIEKMTTVLKTAEDAEQLLDSCNPDQQIQIWLQVIIPQFSTFFKQFNDCYSTLVLKLRSNISHHLYDKLSPKLINLITNPTQFLLIPDMGFTLEQINDFFTRQDVQDKVHRLAALALDDIYQQKFHSSVNKILTTWLKINPSATNTLPSEEGSSATKSNLFEQKLTDILQSPISVKRRLREDGEYTLYFYCVSTSVANALANLILRLPNLILEDSKSTMVTTTSLIDKQIVLIVKPEANCNFIAKLMHQVMQAQKHVENTSDPHQTFKC